LQVGLERLELLPHLGLAVGGRLIDRQLGGERGFLERIGLLPRLLGRHVDGDHLVTALEQRLEHRLAEGLLAVDDNTHGKILSQNPDCSLPPCGGGLRRRSWLRATRARRTRDPHPLPSPQGEGRRKNYAAAAAGFSGAVIAPEPLIAAISSAE